MGVLLYWIALTVGGTEQGVALANPNTVFLDVVRATIPWLVMRSIAGVAMTLGQLCFFTSMIWMLARRPGAESGPTLIGPAPLPPGGDAVGAT